LFIGTLSDNTQDCLRKGRGNRIGARQLTQRQVTEIREDNRMQYLIAKYYGVHQTTVHYIKCRKTWRAV
jgi:hypothetical protein